MQNMKACDPASIVLELEWSYAIKYAQTGMRKHAYVTIHEKTMHVAPEI